MRLGMLTYGLLLSIQKETLSCINYIFPLDQLFFVIHAALNFCQYSFSNYIMKTSKTFYIMKWIGNAERKRTVNSKEGKEIIQWDGEY